MSYEKIDEQIAVAAVFTEAGKVKLKSFRWRGQVFLVKQVQLVSQLYKGQFLVYRISVSNGEGAFKLMFNTESLHWFLEEAYWK